MLLNSFFPLLALVVVTLVSIEATDECLQGEEFFKVPGSEVCYRLFNDEKRTWQEAQALCQSHGLHLVEDPMDDTSLGKYIAEKYGENKTYWMGARDEFGSGTFQYQQSGNIIPATLSGGGSPLEYSKDGCLSFSTRMDLEDPYFVPYFRQPCGQPYGFTVCQELIKIPQPKGKQSGGYFCDPRMSDC